MGINWQKELINEVLKELYNNYRLCGFIGIEGSKYRKNKELMVIGRAVNGWNSSFSLKELSSSNKISQTIVKESGWGTDEGMAWLPENEYNAISRPFWNITRKIMIALGIVESDCKDWYEYLTWTNLYKIAPAERDNPSDDLAKAQRNGCIEILKKEVEYWSPKKIIFMTGIDWLTEGEKSGENVSFKEGLGLDWKETKGKIVLASSRYGKAKFIVTERPEFKKQNEFVSEVKNAFNLF